MYLCVCITHNVASISLLLSRRVTPTDTVHIVNEIKIVS